MKAIVIQGLGDAQLVNDRPAPKLRDDYIKVKTVAVALNPTGTTPGLLYCACPIHANNDLDWKHIDYMASEGAVVGCDYSGIVEEVGKGVTKDFKKGDRVFGGVHGSNAGSHPMATSLVSLSRTNHADAPRTVQHENGAFAEYIVAKAAVQTHIPEKLSFEEAATLPIGIITVGQGLYQSLKLPLPTEPSKDGTPLLIYGGSSATGTIAIQFAKLSGLTVITTASPHNHQLCKDLGADAVFDYNDPTCAERIREYTKNNLHHAFDTISNEQTAAICAAALSTSSSGPKIYSSLLSVKKLPRDDVQNNITMAYTALGENFKMGPKGQEVPGSKEDFEYATP